MLFRRPMQLGRSSWILFVALAMAGCARPSQPVEAPSVSTTRTSAAELASEAPHVGEPQTHVSTEPEGDEARPKDEPRREPARRPGGGFSGYK